VFKNDLDKFMIDLQYTKGKLQWFTRNIYWGWGLWCL